jgi:hypothetical protein
MPPDLFWKKDAEWIYPGLREFWEKVTEWRLAAEGLK